jgi:hypothetical protein
LKALKDIEHKTHLEAAAMGLDMQADLVTGPHNMLGIELNEYAAELARVTVWIGELQWRLSHGYEFKKNPVLEPLDTIECRDALIEFLTPPVKLPLPLGEKNDKLPLPLGEGGGEGFPIAVSVSGNEARVGQTPAAHTLRFLKSPQMSAPPAPQPTVSSASNLGSDPRPKAAGSDPNLGAPNLRIQLAKAVEASWPWANIVIGNPPFLGGSKKRRELGDDYFNALANVFQGRVPAGADLVCYWFDKARAQIVKKGLGAAGFVATQAIRAGSNRIVLKAVVSETRIFEAWSDEPWVNDGAAVRVSLVCLGWGQCCFLNGREVKGITSDLSDGTVYDLTQAKPLAQNSSASFEGTKKYGEFDIPGETARDWLRQPNPHGKPNSEVIKPWRNGIDLTRRPNDTWIIDFGSSMLEHDAMLFEAPFVYAQRVIQAGRKLSPVLSPWWQHERPRVAMRIALDGLPRYIATSRVSKHRFFVFLDSSVLPDTRLNVVARSDDTLFGVVSSRIHELWSLKTCSFIGVGNDPIYNAKSCFETFPFPKGLTPADTAHQKTEAIAGGALIPADILTSSVRTAAEKIAQAAKRLNDLREAWLNPPDWTDRVPEVTPLGMTSSPYPDRILPKPGFEKDLADRTLTKLYNARPAWLDTAHKTLDEAVAAAYGWADYAFDMPDEEILKRLLALNLERSTGGWPKR